MLSCLAGWLGSYGSRHSTVIRANPKRSWAVSLLDVYTICSRPLFYRRLIAFCTGPGRQGHFRQDGVG